MSSDVRFESEVATSNVVGNIQIAPDAPRGMLVWLVRSKVVANTRQAEYLLLVFVALLISLTILITLNFAGVSHTLTSQQLLQIQQVKSVMSSRTQNL